MKKVICPECNGKGKYTILNAYDKRLDHEITCEYCFGSGEKNPFIRSVPIDDLSREVEPWETAPCGSA